MLNPMIQQMFGNNPNFHRAMQMVQGKSEEQVRQTVLNLMQSQGLTMNDLQRIAASYGMRL